ncbi:4-hydroxy-tetrahydrodipicolinate synthase [Streptomyces sp. SID3343]|uniref:4-hydroxy-tetrahydrodipicolinate synthase family protein n=1 Tax=Streptomyces sp. SID3343 TaxID=2690260 RepID=UPI0013694958|nr:4-hydroxy-tetrahydrodipicolinate synthase [Streptomyces sp. SID3343]MYV99344.1 4-hydroxy-tetrahydrodipicolinate synthase [Streptomyces sp. SID3343]
MTDTPTEAPRGLLVPLVTPFTADGEHVALDALEALAHSLLDDGAIGLVALGTTGEPATLDTAEKDAVVAVCARVCRDRAASLIVGAGGNDTRASVQALAALADRPEIHAALTTVPSFTRPSEAGVVAHFTRLAAHSPVPLIIYNIPYRTGLTLGVETLLRLADIPGVMGFKHAVGGVDQETVELLAAERDDLAIWAGDDLYVSPMLALGAAGGILASAHLATRHFAELIRAWHVVDADTARPLGHALARLSVAVFSEPNPTVLKGVLHRQGRIPSPAVRLPLLPAQAASVEAATACLAQFDK